MPKLTTTSESDEKRLMTKAEQEQATDVQARRAARDRVGARMVHEFRKIMAEAPSTDTLDAMRRAAAMAMVLHPEDYDR